MTKRPGEVLVSLNKLYVVSEGLTENPVHYQDKTAVCDTNQPVPSCLPPPWFGMATGNQQTGREQKDKKH